MQRVASRSLAANYNSACCGNFGQVRERDWCNVISAHEGDPMAYTWLLKNFTLGAH